MAGKSVYPKYSRRELTWYSIASLVTCPPGFDIALDVYRRIAAGEGVGNRMSAVRIYGSGNLFTRIKLNARESNSQVRSNEQGTGKNSNLFNTQHIAQALKGVRTFYSFCR